MGDTLVERAQHGDHMAFESLVAGIADRLYTTAHYVLRDQAAAEDATQQALLSMWRHLPDLREPGRFRPWAFRILVREAHAEERKRRQHGPNLILLDDLPNILRESDQTAGIDLHDQLERAFRRLDSRQRAVVALKHYMGFSDSEIAGMLDIPEGTVRSRLHRALGAMRGAIEADGRLAERNTA